MTDMDRTPEEIVDEAGRRVTSAYLLGEYNGRTSDTYYTSWKDATQQDDRLYRGEWDKVFTEEEFATKISPQVMNVISTFVDDLCRLVCESQPTLRVNPRTDKDPDKTKAHFGEAAGMTYWEEADGASIEPVFAGDIAGPGVAFCGVDVKPDRSDYPIPHRIDPRGSLPTWDGDELVDLMVVEEITYLQAQHRFRTMFTDQWDKVRFGEDRVKIVQYWGLDECATVAVGARPEMEGEACYFLDYYDNVIGELEVAGVKRPTLDGRMRGMFTGAGGKLLLMNRFMMILLDGLDQAVYARPYQRGTNYEDVMLKPPHVPVTLFDQDSVVGRMPSLLAEPQVVQIIELLMSHVRSEIGYPESRQGEISGSIWSGSGVQATLGQLTTEVRDVGRICGRLRQRWTNKAYKVDRIHLDFEKALNRSVGKVGMYVPSKHLDEKVRCKIVYGTGAGLDKLNQMQTLYQGLGYHVISRESVMEQMDGIPDIEAEKLRIEQDLWFDATVQTSQKDPTVTFAQMVAVNDAMKAGKPLLDALEDAKAKEAEALAAQQAQMNPDVAAGMPQLAGGEVPSAATEQTSLSKGGTPGSEGLPMQGPLPPMQDVTLNGGP